MEINILLININYIFADEEDETKDHDFEELVKKYVNGLNIGISSEKLIQVHLITTNQKCTFFNNVFQSFHSSNCIVVY